jgi:hypothetical protein
MFAWPKLGIGQNAPLLAGWAGRNDRASGKFAAQRRRRARYLGRGRELDPLRRQNAAGIWWRNSPPRTAGAMIEGRTPDGSPSGLDERVRSACKALAAPFHLHGWPGVHFGLAGGGPACGGGGGGPACGVGITGFAASAGAGFGGGRGGWWTTGGGGV